MEVEKGLGVLTESQGDNGLHREMVMLLQQVSPSQVYKCMIHTALSTNVAQDRPQRVITLLYDLRIYLYHSLCYRVLHANMFK